jgi:hypothetical protein
MRVRQDRRQAVRARPSEPLDRYLHDRQSLDISIVVLINHKSVRPGTTEEVSDSRSERLRQRASYL